MRTRSREINIFNMSLLDILCGALGAFCFMMLVLLPYYKPPGKETDLHNQEAKTQDLLDELEKLRARAQDSAVAQQMTQLMQQLQEQLKQLQGQLNQLSAENDQLKSQNESLSAKSEKQARQLDMRHPFLMSVASYPPQELDVYLESDGISEKKQSNPPFDPSKAHQPTFFNGDVAGWWASSGVTTWMTRDSPTPARYKLYVKVAPPANPSSSPATTTVKSMAFCDTWSLNLPDVTLTPARFWTLVGSFSLTKEGKPAFQEATQAERDAEWDKLAKSSPPPQAKATATPGPAMPFPVQTAQPSAAPLSSEQRRALLEKIEKQRREQQGHPGASPSQSP
ncbi:MAG TPA: hypothetical protein VH330_07825 [Candidatus Udaeobacter sp.]|jgi:TolA-binding protein